MSKFEPGDIVRNIRGVGAAQDVGVVDKVLTWRGGTAVQVRWHSYAGWDITTLRDPNMLELHPEGDYWLADLSAWRLLQ